MTKKKLAIEMNNKNLQAKERLEVHDERGRRPLKFWHMPGWRFGTSCETNISRQQYSCYVSRHTHI